MFALVTIMDEQFNDCCLLITSKENEQFEVFGHRHVWKQFGYLHSLFRLTEPDSIIVKKPLFHIMYNIKIPISKDVIKAILFNIDFIREVENPLEYIKAFLFFDTPIEILDSFIRQHMDILTKSADVFMEFLTQSIHFGLDVMIIQNLISCYFSLLNAKQVCELTDILQEDMPIKKFDVLRHNTFHNNVLFVCSNQSQITFRDMVFNIYTTSAWIDREETSGFWISCKHVQDSDCPTYEECVKSNSLPRVPVSIMFEVYDISLKKPKRLSVKPHRGEFCTFPCKYDFTTIGRYGNIIYKDLYSPLFYAEITFLKFIVLFFFFANRKKKCMDCFFPLDYIDEIYSNMPFDIRFGPATVSSLGELQVYADFGFTNVFSLSNKTTQRFFSLTRMHRKCFHLLRMGDVRTRNSITASVSQQLESFIMSLDANDCDDYMQQLNAQFQKTYLRGKLLSQNKPLFVESD